ncbi:MAG: CAP domain-containing protein [Gaiellaceae bacterium MAG52_C11]|nr:CAP domain-containing protein [Candidatus Gaiellasilicea maunaloa]
MKKQIRRASSAVLFALLLGSTAQAATLNTTELGLLEVVNDVRVANGVPPLEVDHTLVRAARAHTGRMLRADVLSHGSFGPRLGSFGARGPRFGENLAWGTGWSGSARALVRAWLASPGHRANLLRRGFRRIGIGARIGTFAGYRGATVVTADFAGR